MTTSATGGFLPPLPSPTVLEDSALIDFFQAWIVGLTGLTGANVRPRWQDEPPNIQDATVNWVAFGISTSEADTNAAELHDGPGSGYNELRRHEEILVKCSFYGAQARGTAALLRDAMSIAQNREILSLNSMGLINCTTIVSFPELIKQKWYNRADVSFHIRRQVVRRFGVLSQLTVGVDLNNERYITHIAT